MNEVTYATVQPTYAELRTKDGKLIYSLSKKDCGDEIPFVVEHFDPDQPYTKVYLTAGGNDIITKLSGADRAFDVSVKDAYVLTNVLKPVEPLVIEVDPLTPEMEADPYQPKKKETSAITKILLALAGWALFN